MPGPGVKAPFSPSKPTVMITPRGIGPAGNAPCGLVAVPQEMGGVLVFCRSELVANETLR